MTFISLVSADILPGNVDTKWRVSESLAAILLRFSLCSRCHSFGIWFQKLRRAQLGAQRCWGRSALLWVLQRCHTLSPQALCHCGVTLTSHLAPVFQAIKQWVCQFKDRFWVEKLESVLWLYQVRGNSLGFMSRKAKWPQLHAAATRRQ